MKAIGKTVQKIRVPYIILLPEMFNTSFCPKSNHLAENYERQNGALDE